MLQERHGDHWIPIAQLEDAIVEARPGGEPDGASDGCEPWLKTSPRPRVAAGKQKACPGEGQAFRAGCANLPEGAGVAVGLGFDLLLADLASDGLLASEAVLGQADPLDRYRLRGHDRPFGVQGDLVLFFRDLRP